MAIGLEANSSDLSCDGVVDNHQGFQVYCRQNSGTNFFLIKIKALYAYRWTDEGDCLIDVPKQDSVSIQSFCFLVEKSDFLEWFHVQSAGLKRGQSIKHFSLSFTNDTLDVLALDAPEINRIGGAEYARQTGFVSSEK